MFWACPCILFLLDRECYIATEMNENLISQDVYVNLIWVIIYSIIQYNKTGIAYFPPYCDIRIKQLLRWDQDLILSIRNRLDCLIVNSFIIHNKYWNFKKSWFHGFMHLSVCLSHRLCSLCDRTKAQGAKWAFIHMFSGCIKAHFSFETM